MNKLQEFLNCVEIKRDLISCDKSIGLEEWIFKVQKIVLMMGKCLYDYADHKHWSPQEAEVCVEEIENILKH